MDFRRFRADPSDSPSYRFKHTVRHSQMESLKTHYVWSHQVYFSTNVLSFFEISGVCFVNFFDFYKKKARKLWTVGDFHKKKSIFLSVWRVHEAEPMQRCPLPAGNDNFPMCFGWFRPGKNRDPRAQQQRAQFAGSWFLWGLWRNNRKSLKTQHVWRGLLVDHDHQ